MIYLASPYNHPNPEIMETRFWAAADKVVKLMQAGRVVYSPIVHNHHLAVNYSLPRTMDFWMQFDLPILERCDSMIVLTIPGWGESKGVTAEIAFAKQHNIPIEYEK